MSCINCKLDKKNFKTEQDFCAFDKQLQQLVNDNKLRCLGYNKGSKFFEIKYQCSFCHAIWVLAIPDQAFRGGCYEER